MVLITSCVLLAALPELIAGGPLSHRSHFILLPRLLNQTSPQPSLATSSIELPQISIVPVPSNTKSSPGLPTASVKPASSASNDGQPQNISQSSILTSAIPTQIPNETSPGAGSSPVNSATTTRALNITTSPDPTGAPAAMTGCSETAQAGNSSDAFPFTSSPLPSTPVPLSSAAISQSPFPLANSSNTGPTTPIGTTPDTSSVATSSAAAASTSADIPNAVTATSPTAIPASLQPTSSVVIITITRSHTITVTPNGPSATPAASPELTIPSVLTVNPPSSTMTITVPVVSTPAAPGGQLSIVPINPQSAGDGNAPGEPTVTVTVTVGMMTTTTTVYFVSESQSPKG